MFSKKNKSGGTAPSPDPQPMRPSGGGSLFAPGLNPSPTHFNFTPIAGYAQQAAFESASAPTDIPAPPPLHWDPTPSFETEPSFSQTLDTVPNEPTIPEVLPSNWAQETPVELPAEPSMQVTPAPWEMETETTSFETPALGDLPPLAPEMYLPEPTVVASSSTPGVAEPREQFEWEPLPSLDMNTPAPVPAPSYEASTPLPIPETPDTNWAAWTPPEAPGDTSTVDPAAFLDTVNQQLYPEDPFADPMAAIEGAQAFADAAQFLFPETATASLDWQDDNEVTSFTDGGFDTGFSLEMPSAEPLELGPSYQPTPGDLNDLSAFDSQDTEISTFMTSELETEAWTEGTSDFGGFEASFETTTEASAAEASVLTDEMPDFGLPTLPPQADASLLAAFDMGDEGPDLPISSGLSEAFEDAYAFSSAEESTDFDEVETSNWELPAIEPALPPSDYTPPESVEMDFEPTAWEPEEDTATPKESLEVGESVSFDELLTPLSANEPLQNPVPEETLAPNSLAAFLSDDDDFYASSFTLTDQGDVIPSYDTSTTNVTLIEFTDEVTPSATPQEPQIEEFTLELPSPAFEPEPIASLPPEPVRASVQAPQPIPSGPPTAEELWETPALGETLPDQPEVPQPQLSFDNLEILGVCQLSTDKRLLLVQSQGNFALMGQAGLDNPQISVLKMFDHNPIAYQNTFAAAQEGQAGAQGMYVTQVGTWHAIISTFQDQIVLHTELG